MKRHLRQRLPFILLAMVLCAGLCLRFDLQARQSARDEAARLVERMLDEGEVGALGYTQPDLGWLRLYPQVRSATLIAADGQTMAGYQSPGQAGSEAPYRLSSSRRGLSARLETNLPGWKASRTELPVVALTILLVMLALPRHSGSAWRRPPRAGTGGLQARDARPPLVVELDPDLRITRVSRGIESYGYSSEALIGSSITALVERFHPGQPRAVEGVTDGQGGRVDSVIMSSPVQNAEGAVEKLVVTLEGHAGGQDKALEIRYERLKSLVNSVCQHAPDPVLFLDSHANLVYSNSSFQQACGGPWRDLISLVCPRDRLGFLDSLQNVIKTKGAAELELTLQVQGRSVILQGSLHPFESAETGAALAIGMFRDVTDARRMAEELTASRERVSHSQKIEALGRLAGGVAHDFNNLLTTMTLNLEALQGSCLEPVSRGHVEEIAIAARKAAGISRQLLLYSRKKALEPAPISCHTVIEETRRLTERVRRNTLLSTRLKAVDETVLMEEGQLDQVLLNLVVNATDAVSKEGGRIEVETENLDLDADNRQSLPAGRYLALRVRDNGSGIPEEIQSKIFEPYFTTKAVGQGTGLGLSTVVATVEKANGRLVLSSRPGCTTFEIFLPVTAQKGRVAASPETRSAPLPGKQARDTVLLVEDEAAIRALVHRLLERKGYRVTSVSSGSAAQEILRAGQTFDILVTDLQLPGASGPEVALCFQRKRPHAPVLFMSGNPGDTMTGQNVPSPARFLAKPFSPDDLYGSLNDLLLEAAS